MRHNLSNIYANIFENHLNPVNHWIALAEYSQMSTHDQGFRPFSGILHHFVLAKLATSGIRVKVTQNYAGVIK